jgi:hypothetical protein
MATIGACRADARAASPLPSAKAVSRKPSAVHPRRLDISARHAYNPAMNLAQKVAVAVTLLAVALFLFIGGHKVLSVGGWYGHTAEEIADRGLKNVVPLKDAPAGIHIGVHGNPDDVAGVVWTNWRVTDWPKTCVDIIGILLVGGAAVVLLGIKHRRSKDEQQPAA